MSTQVLDLGDWGSAEELDMAKFERVEPGQYHVVISGVQVEPVTGRGSTLEGVRVMFQVLAGTVAGQENRSFDDIYWWPKHTSKDGGKFANKKLVKLATATGLLRKDLIGKAKEVTAPNWADMENRQVIVGVKHEVNGEYTHARVDNGGMAIWSLDDPHVTDVPRDASLAAPSTPQAAQSRPAAATDYSDL